ncbi:DUF899 family protein [Bradyrhizobium sp. 190]|uniref:DUF899 family protein n=1 Tax=Bradyrhizobium sp. 190 TaxID=2782658 RepID=UPI0035AC1822
MDGTAGQTRKLPGLTTGAAYAAAHHRGLDMMNAAYHYLDLTPLGRHEQGLPYRWTGCGYVTNTSRRRFRHLVVIAKIAWPSLRA